MEKLGWIEKKMHRIGVWQLGVLKLVLIAIGMIIGAYLSEFVKLYLWTFVIISVIGYAYLIYIFFK